MNRFITVSLLTAMVVLGSHAEEIAVFPVIGINTDKSYMDAFGMLLAKKYESVSGLSVANPLQSGRALGDDTNYVSAAEKLGVAEYIELTAVGLYLSRKEQVATWQGDTTGNRMVIVLKDDNRYREQSDQELLDKSKTVVTAVRRDRTGRAIHKAELTLVTYGDIEEACDRFATALFQRISVEEARSLSNITRREGMGKNKLFAEKLSGIKVGGYYPVVIDDGALGSLTYFATIGYNMRMESERFFVEFGVNGRFPSAMFDESKRRYGGVGVEVGGSYLFTTGTFGLYAGGGVIPHFNFLKGAEMGLAPYLQGGITLPRNTRTRFFVDLRIAQNVLPVSTGTDTPSYSYYSTIPEPTLKAFRPMEIGMNVGIGW